jgi:hypothetical protein
VHPGWERWLTPHLTRLLDTRLGPAILADARRAVPVLSGDLYRDLGSEAHDGQLRVGPRGATDYGAAVEMGSTHVSPRGTVYQIAAQPFLRPALFRRRSP